MHSPFRKILAHITPVYNNITVWQRSIGRIKDHKSARLEPWAELGWIDIDLLHGSFSQSVLIVFS